MQNETVNMNIGLCTFLALSEMAFRCVVWPACTVCILKLVIVIYVF